MNIFKKIASFFCKKTKPYSFFFNVTGTKTDPVHLKQGVFPLNIKFSYTNYMSPEDCFTYTVKAEQEKYFLEITSMIYKDGEVFRTEIPEETFDHVADLADSCGVTEWNGFHGCNHDVCDGDGFSFSASYSDGNRVNASGSNCWPDNYGTFNHEMRDLFDSYRKQYNYDRLPKTIESDELDYIMINFCQQGTSGHSKFEFNFSRAASYGNNLNAFVFDCNGEFGKEMQRESEQIKAASTIESPDFTGIQSVIRKYDLPSLNGYDKAAEDYLNSEWFQFHFGYSDGEYIDLMGTDPPDNYDAIRHDLITACLAIIENMDILKKNN